MLTLPDSGIDGLVANGTHHDEGTGSSHARSHAGAVAHADPRLSDLAHCLGSPTATATGWFNQSLSPPPTRTWHSLQRLTVITKSERAGNLCQLRPRLCFKFRSVRPALRCRRWTHGAHLTLARLAVALFDAMRAHGAEVHSNLWDGKSPGEIQQMEQLMDTLSAK